MLLQEPVGTIGTHDCGSALPPPATGAPHPLVLAPLCPQRWGRGTSWNLDVVCLKGANFYTAELSSRWVPFLRDN